MLSGVLKQQQDAMKEEYEKKQNEVDMFSFENLMIEREVIERYYQLENDVMRYGGKKRKKIQREMKKYRKYI